MKITISMQMHFVSDRSIICESSCIINYNIIFDVKIKLIKLILDSYHTFAVGLNHPKIPIHVIFHQYFQDETIDGIFSHDLNNSQLINKQAFLNLSSSQ